MFNNEEEVSEYIAKFVQRLYPNVDDVEFSKLCNEIESQLNEEQREQLIQNYDEAVNMLLKN